MLTLATSSLITTSPKPNLTANFSNTIRVVSISFSAMVKAISRRGTSSIMRHRWDWMIISTLILWSASAIKICAAMPGRSGIWRIPTWARFKSRATPRTGGKWANWLTFVGGAWFTPKALHRASMAKSPWDSSIRQLTLTSEVEIISILILASARVLNILAAMPGRPMIPAPAIAILATRFSTITSASWVLLGCSRRAGAIASVTDSALVNICLTTVKAISLLFPSWIDWIIRSTSTRWWEISPNNLAAIPGRSGILNKATFAWSGSNSTESTALVISNPTSDRGLGGGATTLVPGASLQLERTTNKTPKLRAISTALGCNTFAPKLASSSISSQVISSNNWASGTKRGSVVKMPGTSV